MTPPRSLVASLTNQTHVTLGEAGSSSLGPISEYESTLELWSLPGPILTVHGSEFPVRGLLFPDFPHAPLGRAVGSTVLSTEQ